MKITAMETFFVRPRWLFLKVTTDVGLVGWGEPIVEGRARTTAEAVKELEPFVLGADPRRIEHLWQRIYRGAFYRGGPVLTSALSGLDMALWDILGKSLGAPVHQLLGGAVRDKIRLYAWARGDSPAELAASGRQRREEGFTAVKAAIPERPMAHVVNPKRIDEEVARIGALRDAVGDDFDIGLDFHGRVNPAMAIRLARALEPLRPMFIEEPCLPENIDALATIARSTSIPVATGERLFTRWGFREVFEKQAVAIAQPDLSHAGGISECRRIAAMAEAHYVAMAPHCPLGPISLAACLQLDAATPNFLIQEHVTLGEGYLKEPFERQAGHVVVPNGPGLGIEVDEGALAGPMADDGSWRTPQWSHDDGSVAEW